MNWFSKAHNLSIKKPQRVEYVSVSQVNPFNVFGFFDNLETIFQENCLQNKPHLVYNCDETSFCHDPSKTKVVGAVGEKCTRTISSPARENTTVLVGASASGTKLPMLCVFKGKNIMKSWVNEDVLDSVSYAASKKGWMDGEIFLKWFKKEFLPSVPQERPILLIFDGHVSHISVNLIECAVENKVILLKLLPIRHVPQLLDVAVFKSMKTAWDKKLAKWQRLYPRRKIPKDLFVKILNEVFNEMPIENVCNGFKPTGKYDDSVKGPNRKIAEESCKYKPSEVVVYKKFMDERIRNETSQPGTTSEATALSINETESAPSEQRDSVSQPGTSSGEPTSVQPPLRRNFEDFVIDVFQQKKGTNAQANAPLQKRKRVCAGSEILTSIEFLEMKKQQTLMENKSKKKKNQISKQLDAKEDASTESCKQSKTNNKKPAKRGRLKKNVIPLEDEDTSSDSSSTVNISLHSDDSDDQFLSPTSVIKDDFVLVEYDGLHYPGQVLQVEEDRIRIKHMKSTGVKYWKWPEEDTLWYNDIDIIKIIGIPIPVNNHGPFSVPEARGFDYVWNHGNQEKMLKLPYLRLIIT